jgi:segregation and condensation protein B
VSTEDPTPATDDEIPDLDALAEVGLAAEAAESSDTASAGDAASPGDDASGGAGALAVEPATPGEAASLDEAAEQETPAESTTDSAIDSAIASTAEDQLPLADSEPGLIAEAEESSDAASEGEAASPGDEAPDSAAEAVGEPATPGEAVAVDEAVSLDEAAPSDEAAAQPEAAQQETPAEPASESTIDSAIDSTAEGQLPPDDPESDLVAAGDENELPDVSSDEQLEAALEALLLVVDSPINEESLGDTVGVSVARVTVALRTMAQKFTERASGIDLRRVGEGWRFYTRDTYAPFVEKLLLDGQRSKLTRAALESLAVIAYRQPVTRARVAAVRGVNVDGVIRTLLARGLIEEMGTDPETTGTLYVTTELFLERLGLSSLNDLPPIAPLLPEVDTIDDI